MINGDTGKSIKILVIDDDISILHSIEKQLNNPEFYVDFINDPIRGLEKIEHKKYNLVISDVMMKPISGLDVLKKIKARHPELPVIILTGFVDDQIIDNAKKIGSNDFLIKPVRKKELIDSIHNVLLSYTS